MMSDIKNTLRHTCFLLAALFIVAGHGTAVAGVGDSNAPPSWLKKINYEWGGYIKALGISSWHDDRTLFRTDEDNPFYDGSAFFRLKNRLLFSDTYIFDVHYQAILTGGDTFRKQNKLKKQFPAIDDVSGFQQTINDDRRLLHLTDIVDNGESHSLYQRLDRLVLTIQGQWGAVRIGRQAITWGNGFLFNPMDLFNPFSPIDIDREYKTGDDMASVRIPVGNDGDLQFLLVPRRDLATGKVAEDQSSLAGKLHFPYGSTEFDFMLARHYDENVAGVGSAGYFRDAAWRMDVTWTSVNQSQNRDGYFSMTANMDYSWVWLKKNFYGFVEFYYNGLGTDQYAKAYADQQIANRLERGELFFLGRSYLSGQVNMELHPLVNLYLTIINNLYDPSGIVQPWVVWNMTQDTNLKLGANFYYGGHETEFGGYEISSTPFLNKPPDSMFLWLTWYF
ncbi:MAG: hypothetical protein GXP53_09610 [Deltaproteobacteria bacterium]|nr:hypothetical protein [Deltaproteobacteria bacterium]